MTRCNADCCKGGVWVDVKEHDRILAHAPMIQHHMDPGQEHDKNKWFENYSIADPDFPSGKAVGTQVIGDVCVFLKSDGKCVLQTAAVGEGLDRFALKPFFCVAYPVSIEDGELTLEDDDYTSRQECCSYTTDGRLTVFDVCREELEFMLGKEASNELEKRSREAADSHS